MNLESFFEEAERLDIRLSLPSKDSSSINPLDNEALFQLPLLAMVILALSKGRSKPMLTHIGQLVGECLESSVPGFKGSSQDIGWSANLRIRTIKALRFLECTQQIIIDKKDNRIKATRLGSKLYTTAINLDTPLSHALEMIELSYQRILDEARVWEKV